MEVHNILGAGFLEAVYQDALEREFILRRIPYVREYHMPVYFKGYKLDSSCRVDFFCYEEIPVELKALRIMSGTEEAQSLNYLKASKTKVGLLVNFGKPSLDYTRFVM